MEKLGIDVATHALSVGEQGLKQVTQEDSYRVRGFHLRLEPDPEFRRVVPRLLSNLLQGYVQNSRLYPSQFLFFFQKRDDIPIGISVTPERRYFQPVGECLERSACPRLSCGEPLQRDPTDCFCIPIQNPECIGQDSNLSQRKQAPHLDDLVECILKSPGGKVGAELGKCLLVEFLTLFALPGTPPQKKPVLRSGDRQGASIPMDSPIESIEISPDDRSGCDPDGGEVGSKRVEDVLPGGRRAESSERFAH